MALTEEQAERLASVSAALWRDGVEARWVPAAVTPDLEPNVSKEAHGGLFIPMHGYVGVASLTSAAVAAAEDRGTELVVEAGALAIRGIPGGGVAVTNATGAWEADLAVMAAGSWSSRIRVEGADPVPVKPIRGQLLQLRAEPGLLRRPIWGEAGYLVPWPDGSVLVGATVEDVGFDESSTHEARRTLLDMAASLVPALKTADFADARAGLRPKSPDDLPLVGRSRVVPGLHLRDGPLSQRRVARAAHRRARPAAGTGPRRAARGRSWSPRGAEPSERIAGRSIIASTTDPTVMALLSDTEIEQQLAGLPGWARVDRAIRKQFTFQDFPEAVLFVSALVPAAETADHHPDIEIHYKRVTLTYSTHSEGGLTEKDFDGARAADDVAGQVPHLREFGDG